MFAFKGLREQLVEERRKSARLEAVLNQTSAKVEYIAMMTDVEIDEGGTEDDEI